MEDYPNDMSQLYLQLQLPCDGFASQEHSLTATLTTVENVDIMSSVLSPGSDYVCQVPGSQDNWNFLLNSQAILPTDSQEIVANNVLVSSVIEEVLSHVSPPPFIPNSDRGYRVDHPSIGDGSQVVGSNHSFLELTQVEHVENGQNNENGEELQRLCRSFSQTSTTSVDDSFSAMEPWRGCYNFDFSFSVLQSRKFQFSTTQNKLYSLKNRGNEINFKYDFEKCEPKDMSLVAFLRYVNADVAHAPVARCTLDEVTEKKSLEDTNQATEQNLNLVYHVLRCNHKKAEHFRDNASGKFIVKVPLGTPQPGMRTISRLFKFCCSGSCKSSPNIKSPIAVVFELHERGKVVGRASFTLKVCACPFRDCLRDEAHLKNNSGYQSKRKQPKLTRKRLKRLKQPFGSKIRNHRWSRSQRPGNAACDKSGVLHDQGLRIAELSDPFMSSQSQESLLTGNESGNAVPESSNQTLDKLLHSIRAILMYCYRKDNSLPCLLAKDFAKRIKGTLKLVEAVRIKEDEIKSRI